MTAGYGAEIWCAGELVTGRMAYGVAAVAHALYRRATTRRGTLRGGDDESAYGVDVEGLIGQLGARDAVAALPGMLRAEWLKDDRVADVDVTATRATAPNGDIDISIAASVTLEDSGESFDFTIVAASGGLSLLIGGAS